MHLAVTAESAEAVEEEIATLASAEGAVMASFLFSTCLGNWRKNMSDLWTIKDADGNVTNPQIKATEEFVAANFDHYEAYIVPVAPEPTAEEAARAWRDSELAATDYVVPLSDHPKRADYMTYRATLRDWPADSDNFPGTKPELG
jgi:hypothetical protein